MSTTISNYLESKGIRLTQEQYKKIIVYNLGHKIAKEYKVKGMVPDRITEECNGIEVKINSYDWERCPEAKRVLDVYFKI